MISRSMKVWTAITAIGVLLVITGIIWADYLRNEKVDSAVHYLKVSTPKEVNAGTPNPVILQKTQDAAREVARKAAAQEVNQKILAVEKKLEKKIHANTAEIHETKHEFHQHVNKRPGGE